ncbi:MAG: hypothetical protein J5659_00405 [Clostridia bacterium]|nr:hypothetical protein [Clostridia bacterium]
MTEVLIKALCILLITAGLAISIGNQKREYAFIMIIACGALVLIMMLDAVMPYILRVKTVLGKASGAASFFSLPLKALGIAYLTDFTADTCRDFGFCSLAAKAELAGKCAIFVLCVPSAVNILEVALKFSGL